MPRQPGCLFFIKHSFSSFVYFLRFRLVITCSTSSSARVFQVMVIDLLCSLVCSDDALDSPSGESAQPPALFALAYSEPNEPFPAPLGSRDSGTDRLTHQSRLLVLTRRSGVGRAGFESVPASHMTGESVDGISPRSKALF